MSLVSGGSLTALNDMTSARNALTFSDDDTTSFYTSNSGSSTISLGSSNYHIYTHEDRKSIIKRFGIWLRELKSKYSKEYRKRVFNPNRFFNSLKKSLM